MRRLALAACLALAPAVSALADASAALRDRGIAAALAALEAAPQGKDFERGSLMVLRALETALQTAARHGLVDRAGGLMAMRPLRNRLVRGVEPPAPETLSRLITTLLADLTAARAVLAAPADPAPFTLDLTAVWFDLNANGLRDRNESAMEMLLPLFLSRRDLAARRDASAGQPVEVRFDAADRDWLVAYTHMVAGSGHLYLAFDPTPILADLAERAKALANLPVLPDYYDRAALRARLPVVEADIADLDRRLAATDQAIRPQRDRSGELNTLLRAKPTPADSTALKAEQEALRESLSALQAEYLRLQTTRRAHQSELAALKAALSPQDRAGRSSTADLAEMARDPLSIIHVTLTALRQQPDVAHLQALRDNWLAMIAANRRFWAAVAAETDNDREWIPNEAQQSAIGVTLEPGTAEAWQSILADAEAVLQGRLLLPHPMLPEGVGISLASWFDDPGPLDVIAVIHGSGLWDHAARGPKISTMAWQRFRGLAQGRAGALALWFN